MREVVAGLGTDEGLVVLDQAGPVVRLHVGVEAVAVRLLLALQKLLEGAVPDAEHDIAVHLDQAAVAVVGEAGIAAGAREAVRTSRR